VLGMPACLTSAKSGFPAKKLPAVPVHMPSASADPLARDEVMRRGEVRLAELHAVPLMSVMQSR
jgi:hypothetical protein